MAFSDHTYNTKGWRKFLGNLLLPGLYPWFQKDTTGKSRFANMVSDIGSGVKNWFDNSAVGNYIKSAADTTTGAHLTGSQVEANEMQMQNQEDIFGRQVAGMQKAGLNPALMYDNGIGSAPSVQGSQGTGSMSDLMSLIMLPLNKKLLQAQIGNVRADTRDKIAGAEGKEIENQFKPDIFSQNLRQGELNIENTQAGIRLVLEQTKEVSSKCVLNRAEVNEVIQRASLEEKQAANEALRSAGIESNNDLIAQQFVNARLDGALKLLESSVMESQVRLNNAQARSVSLDSVYKEWQKEYREKFGTNPDQAIWNGILGILGKASDNIVGSSLFGNLKGQSEAIADFIEGLFKRGE